MLPASTPGPSVVNQTLVAAVASETFLQKLFVDVEQLPDDFYGFLQLTFLGLAYGYILMFGANLIKDGSELLLLIPSWAGLVGSIVLPVLGAVPDGAIVLFSGIGPDAQKQLGVGIGALAGSTIMLLTVPWFLSMIAGRVNMGDDGLGTYSKPKNAREGWSKLSPPNRYRKTCVNVGPSIRKAAITMAITMIPFFIIQIPAAATSCSLEKDVDDGDCKTPRVAAIIAGVCTVILFFAYLIQQKLEADADIVAGSKVEATRQKAITSGLMSLRGIFTLEAAAASPNTPSESTRLTRESSGVASPLTSEPTLRKFLRPFFRKFDRDGSGTLDTRELQFLLESLGEKPSLEDVDVVMNHIDRDKSGTIDFEEFVHAMKMVLEEHAASGASTPLFRGAVSRGHFDPPAPTDEEMRGEGGAMQTEVSLGVDPIQANGDTDEEEEEEDEEMPEDLANLSPEEQRKRILRRAFGLMAIGTFVVVLFSDPMVDVLSRVGQMTNIKPFYISFIFAPLVSNGSELIAAYSYAGKKTEKSMTIALATLVGSSAMNNTFCLGIFLFLVFAKDLLWVFTAEVMSIVFVEVAMLAVIFLNPKKLEIWIAGLVIVLFPLSILLVWFLENVLKLD